MVDIDKKYFLTGLDGRLPARVKECIKLTSYHSCYEAAIKLSSIEGSLIWEVVDGKLRVVHTVLKSVNGEALK